MPPPIYGIDLGTTYTKCALVRPDDGVVEVFKLDRERSDSPQNTLPILRSAVTVGTSDGRKTAFVGARSLVELEQWSEGDPEIRRFDETKIYIGEDVSQAQGDPPPWLFAPHGWSYRPEDVGAIILRKLKREVEAAGGPEMKRVVVTHPQYFTEARRKATRQAAEIAGLEIVDTITEPDAAALLYGVEGQAGRFMIFDLGGGTLDVTIVQMEERRLRVLASDGEKIGGRDFDRKIFARMVAEYQALYPEFDSAFLDERTRQVWMREAERLKRQLNDPEQPVGRVRYQCQSAQFPDGRIKALNIKRDEFVADTQPLVDDAVKCAGRALEAAKGTWAELSGVICVGGSSRLTHLRQALAAITDKVLPGDVDIDTAIAHGAAIHGHRLGHRAPTVDVPPGAPVPGRGEQRAAIALDVELVGALARGLGVRVRDRASRRDVIYNLVPKDTPIPYRARKTFRTVERDRLEVELYEGEESDPDLCELLGRVEMSGVALGPPGQPVEVTLEIEGSGQRHLVVETAGSRREAVIRFDERRVLPQDDIAVRREFIAGLVIF
jgi:molecular chaperone DnaK